jgi:hypothetical protein
VELSPSNIIEMQHPTSSAYDIASKKDPEQKREIDPSDSITSLSVQELLDAVGERVRQELSLAGLIPRLTSKADLVVCRGEESEHTEGESEAVGESEVNRGGAGEVTEGGAGKVKGGGAGEVEGGGAGEVKGGGAVGRGEVKGVEAEVLGERYAVRGGETEGIGEGEIKGSEAEIMGESEVVVGDVKGGEIKGSITVEGETTGEGNAIESESTREDEPMEGEATRGEALEWEEDEDIPLEAMEGEI